jgi:MmyB-like transcription regulator ligand binding domain
LFDTPSKRQQAHSRHGAPHRTDRNGHVRRTGLALHPSGLAPAIVNLAQWSAYLLRRVDQQVLATGESGLAQLAAEVRGYPGIGEATAGEPDPLDRVFVPLHLRSGEREFRFLNMVATFGTALDITAAELVIEVFFPADPATATALGRR